MTDDSDIDTYRWAIGEATMLGRDRLNSRDESAWWTMNRRMLVRHAPSKPD